MTVPLASLLEGLRRQKALVTPQELEHRLPPLVATGIGSLDALLGGGLPEGRITEVRGPGGSGLAAAVVAAITSGGRLAAWIDRPDALDPRTVAAAGVDLRRLLWCRATSRKDALRAADVLLTSRAFALVVIDLDDGGRVAKPGAAAPERRPLRLETGRPELVRVDQEARPIVSGPPTRASVEDRGSGLSLVRWAEVRERPPRRSTDDAPTQGAWLRLARDAEDARAALIALGGGAGTFAAASLHAGKSRARFSGEGPGKLFDGLEAVVKLERSKLGFTPGEATVLLDAPA